jgi:hypothetical protein
LKTTTPRKRGWSKSSPAPTPICSDRDSGADQAARSAA